jgi:hypothetical protein
MFKSYLLLNADAVPAALDRIGGQIHADAVAVGLSSHRLFSRTLNDRLTQVRSGAPVAQQAAASLIRFQFAYAGSPEVEVGPDQPEPAPRAPKTRTSQSIKTRTRGESCRLRG